MSFTAQQRAYHLLKMQTRFTRLDITKDGNISREDYELLSKRMAELTKMTKEQAASTYKEWMKVADHHNFKPGVKISIKDAAQKASDAILATPPDKHKVLVDATHGLLFNAIDTNKNGVISREEFKVYLNVVAPSLSDAEIACSFNTIDSNKNGVISRDEFLAAANDFLGGVEETPLSKAYFGGLIK